MKYMKQKDNKKEKKSIIKTGFFVTDEYRHFPSWLGIQLLGTIRKAWEFPDEKRYYILGIMQLLQRSS